MMDQVTLSQLCDWPPGTVASLPIEVLAALAASLAEMKTLAADAHAVLPIAIERLDGALSPPERVRSLFVARVLRQTDPLLLSF